MDSRNNKIVWQHRLPGDQSYGALSTAGGLVFKGQVDGNLLALDAKTGAELWRFQTGMGISAPPMTWMGSDGVQYVTVAVGGNRGGNTTLDGDEVWTFSLNGTVDEMAAPPPIQTKVELGGALTKLGDPMGAANTVLGDVKFEGTLNLLDYLYQPARVSVPVGTTLNWWNQGTVAHTVTDQGNAFDTGDIAPGQTVSMTFSSQGTFTYFCQPHPWMIAQVVVT
jgi:plastocyanin